MKTKSTPATQAIEFEKKLYRYNETSIEDLILNHCIHCDFLTSDDFTSKSRRYIWLTDVISTQVSAIKLMKMQEEINIRNIDYLIDKKESDARRVIKNISVKLASLTPDHWRP
ncbi:hypothetical protein [Shewanella algae]|uniref:hypothetical protein n=1 Tax=Shewanella algae TaxID=38313 RepID=UPI001BF0DD4D|nr:hypothetical protein [Shewanella algae]BCV28930.1 hypothetical protein TUM3811_27900 [Shewanella algae]